MVKLLHWCALRITDLAEVLFNLGGNLEAWCDEKLNGPADLYLPNKGWLAVPPGFNPITLLDSYEKEQDDAL